jgi:myo-inositol-1(or 4)-monophosphatase
LSTERGPDPVEFVRAMTPSVQRAASIARALEGRVRNIPKAGEETVAKQALTEADTAAQEAVLEGLQASFPFVALEAEEETPGVAEFPESARAVVIIDPIDGTLHSYLEGGGPYTVIVGLAIDDVLCAGLIALPREGLLFSASAGGGASIQRAGSQARTARLSPDAGRMLVSHGTPSVSGAHLRSLGIEVSEGSGGAVAVAPLIPGVRAGLRVARGERGVSIRGRVGALIAREAGALVRGDDGMDFPLDLTTRTDTLRVACTEADLELLDAAVAKIKRD